MTTIKEKKDEKKKRRFVDLFVQEVSLVDDAANQRIFLITKRKQKTEDAMSAFAEEKHENTEVAAINKSQEQQEESKTKETAAEEATKENVEKKAEQTEPEKTKETAAEEATKEHVEKKAEQTESNGLDIKITTDGVHIKGELVTKNYTPEKIRAIKAKSAELNALIDDGKMESEVPVETKQEQVKKSQDDPVMSKLEEIAKMLKSQDDKIESVTKRVEQIEEVRQPSNAVCDEGGTDTPVEKSANIWKGLPLS